ncbi:MAG: hypothetical protein NXI22_16450, partial [bacterium]|nr:hypothetical protein [bacterium]
MKTLSYLALGCVAAVLAVAAPIETAKAEIKPAMVMSVGNMSEMLDDVDYLAKTAGNEGAGTTAKLMAGIFLNGLDRARPAGAYAMFDGMNPQVVVFVPVKDLDVLLKTHKENIGEPRDVGGGVLELSAPNGMPVYVKDVDGWAFVSNEQGLLKETPKDPVKLLDGMDKNYSMAMRVNIQNIPADLRKMAIGEIRAAAERSLDEQAGELDDEQRDAQEKVVQSSLKSVERMLEEAETFTIGWEVDSMNKSTWIDSTMVAVQGSKLARQAAMLSDTKSQFAGFLMDGAAFSMNFSMPVDQEEAAQTIAMLNTSRDRALEELKKDEDLKDPAKRAAAEEIVGTLFDVMSETIEAGKLDGGAVLMLGEGKLQFVGGGFVADGKKLEAAVKKLAKAGASDPEFPEFKFDVATHSGVTLHTATAPIKDADQDVREVLGDKLNLVIGTGEKVIYVAFGKDSMSLMKQVIDASANTAQAEVNPLQMTISMQPILEFAATVDDSPVTARLIEILDSRDAKIKLTSTAIERGTRSRFEIDETVIEMIGKAAQEFG